MVWESKRNENKQEQNGNPGTGEQNVIKREQKRETKGESIFP
tara:strand:- start:60 stop:185 length:126 start_codon:yes stop_codon:yes gene_type:complete